MTIAVATHNKKKGVELLSLLAPLGHDVKTLADLGVTREPEEDGETFLDNARIKALAALAETGLPALADDSGLCVDALDGAPGVYSARFGGFSTDRERNAHLLRLMDRRENRACYFHCSAVLVFPDGTELFAEGRCGGLLLDTPRGQNGFGYDPLFFLPGIGKTMAEITPAEKDALSHRGRALRELMRLLAGNGR